MLRVFACLGLAVVFTGPVPAQSSDGPPKFSASSVRSAPDSNMANLHGGFYVGGRYELHDATMVDLVSIAWGVDQDKVVGGPAWAAKDMFNLIGIAPPDSSQDTLNALLQGLLKDRFQLAVHKDQKDYPAWAMTVPKKALMKPSEGKDASGCKLQPGSPPPDGARVIMMGDGSGNVTRINLDEPLTFACRNLTMAAFADAIQSMTGAPQYLSGNPVVDRTGLQGAWDFDVRFTFQIRNLRGATPAGETITLADAFEKQLGLKLEQTKVPMPVIAIDSVNERFTGDPPGAADLMPPPPTEFDVADIKPTDPKATAQMGAALRGDQLNLRNITLKTLISIAWESGNANNNQIEGGPKSLDSNHWDIVAKAPTPRLANGAKAIGAQYDFAAMMVMLQGLLKDRFKLQVHTEDRQVNGYALVADKPKLVKTSDPSARPECNEGPGPDGKDPRIANPDASRLVTCRNMTMTQFAVEIKNTAGGYLGQYPPLVNATGIDGAYDFTINFSVAGMVNGAGRGGPAAAPPAAGAGDAAEPTRAISLFDALEKQLGLKLESRKVTGQVLVIDHVEDAPTEN